MPVAGPVFPSPQADTEPMIQPVAAPVDTGPAPPPEPPAAIEPEAAAETELARAEPLRVLAEVLASVRDDLDPQLLPIFLEEAQELFPHAGALLRDWRRAPQQREYAQDLRRTLHTLKGSARMAGAMRLGELTHLMESRLMVGEREVAPSPELFDALDNDLDQQASLLDQLQSGIAGAAPGPVAEHAQSPGASSAATWQRRQRARPLQSPAEPSPAPTVAPGCRRRDVGRGGCRTRAGRRDRCPATHDGARALGRDRPPGQ